MHAVIQTEIKSAWEQRLEPLLKFPKQWITVHEYSSVNAARVAVTHLRKGRQRLPRGSWEFRWEQKDAKGLVLARYLGPEAPEGVAA